MSVLIVRIYISLNRCHEDNHMVNALCVQCTDTKLATKTLPWLPVCFILEPAVLQAKNCAEIRFINLTSLDHFGFNI